MLRFSQRLLSLGRRKNPTQKGRTAMATVLKERPQDDGVRARPAANAGTFEAMPRPNADVKAIRRSIRERTKKVRAYLAAN